MMCEGATTDRADVRRARPTATPKSQCALIIRANKSSVGKRKGWCQLGGMVWRDVADLYSWRVLPLS